MAQSKHGRKKSPSHRKAVAARRILLVVTVALLLLLAGGTALAGCSGHGGSIFAAAPTATPEPTPVPTPEPTPEPTPIVETVSFSASGDNLIHAPIYKQAAGRAQGGEKYDFRYAYANMAEFYAQFDVNWINQETLVNDELAPSTYPCFSTPGECAKALYELGMRVFTTSNNHIYDKSAAGIAATRRFWASMPEDVVTSGLWSGGDDYDRIPMHTVNGIKIAYLAYTESTNGIPTPANAEAHIIYTSQTDLMEHQIRLARQQADIVVVGVHWGVEYSHKASDAQKNLAQRFADWGADLIIGTHPHVVQDAAWLNATDGRSVFVAYSLGNFISTQDEKDRLVGLLLSVTFRKTTEIDGSVSTEVVLPEFYPVVTHYDSGRSNCRVYLLNQYTDALATQHGIRSAKYSSFCRQNLVDIIRENVSAEFLAEDWEDAA